MINFKHFSWGGHYNLFFERQFWTNIFENEKIAEAFARIECHYFINGGFFESENWILANVDKIRHIPTVIIQGRYDVVCPMITAWDLHRALPKANFEVVQDAGHSMTEEGITSKLVKYTDKYSEY